MRFFTGRLKCFKRSFGQGSISFKSSHGHPPQDQLNPGCRRPLHGKPFCPTRLNVADDPTRDRDLRPSSIGLSAFQLSQNQLYDLACLPRLRRWASTGPGSLSSWVFHPSFNGATVPYTGGHPSIKCDLDFSIPQGWILAAWTLTAPWVTLARDLSVVTALDQVHPCSMDFSSRSLLSLSATSSFLGLSLSLLLPGSVALSLAGLALLWAA